MWAAAIRGEKFEIFGALRRILEAPETIIPPSNC